MKQNGTILIMVLLTGLLLIGGCGSAASSLDNTYLLAVGSEKCSMKEANVYLTNMRGIYTNDQGADLWASVTSSGDASAEDQLQDLVILRLLYIYCLDQMADSAGVALSAEEETLIDAAAGAYLDTLTQADLDYLQVDTEDITEYYSHFALAEKYYSLMTEDVILSESASSAQEEEQMLEEAKAEKMQTEYEAFAAGVEIAVDEEAFSVLETDESADLQITTNQFFSIYNTYMSAQ